MQLKNDYDFINNLRSLIEQYYAEQDNRQIHVLLKRDCDASVDEICIDFLIDRKYVARYNIIPHDRGGMGYLGAVSLAIGPFFFPPSQFWDYENSERFKLDASKDGIVHNLALLDEFLGYPNALKQAYGYKL